MAIAPLQPHKSWFRHFWYAEHSPRDTLTDRALLFAIVALSLIAGVSLLVRQSATPPVAAPAAATQSVR